MGSRSAEAVFMLFVTFSRAEMCYNIEKTRTNQRGCRPRYPAEPRRSRVPPCPAPNTRPRATGRGRCASCPPQTIGHGTLRNREEAACRPALRQTPGPGPRDAAGARLARRRRLATVPCGTVKKPRAALPCVKHPAQGRGTRPVRVLPAAGARLACRRRGI